MQTKTPTDCSNIDDIIDDRYMMVTSARGPLSFEVMDSKERRLLQHCIHHMHTVSTNNTFNQ